MYKKIGSNITGIVLNLIKIEKIEKNKVKKKYSFRSFIKSNSENLRK